MAMNFIEQVKADVPKGYTKAEVLNKEQEAGGFYVYVQPSYRNSGQKTIFVGKHQFIQNEQGSFLAGEGTDEQGRPLAKLKSVWNCTMEMDTKMAEGLVKTLQDTIKSVKK